MSTAEVLRYNKDVHRGDEHPESLGALIRETRSGAGITVGGLAEQLKVNRSAVQHWEHDRRKPSAFHALKLAEVLGLDLHALCKATHREELQHELQKKESMRFIII